MAINKRIVMHSLLRTGFAGLALIVGMSVMSAPASAATSSPAERRFDFGGMIKGTNKPTPVWPGFQGVTDTDVYSSQRGFGWVIESSHKPEFQQLGLRLLRGHLNPDDLTGDAVIWRGGDKPLRLRVDLPDGKYDVCIWTGGLMGSAIYDRADYAISAGNEMKVQVQRGKEWLRNRLFKEFGDQYEWRSGSDPWEKYVKEQYVDFHRFETTVTDGHLNLGFNMARQHGRANPEEVARYLMINALVIYPADEAKKLDSLLADIQTGRDTQFNEIARLVPPPQKPGTLPAISPKDQAAGYVPFVRGIMEKLNYNSVPEAKEIGQPLALEAALGQRAFGRFAIYPLKDLKGVTLTISPLVNDAGKTLPASAVRWNWFRYHEQEVYYLRRKDMDYRPLPMLLMPAEVSDAVQGVPRAFGVAVTPPKDAVPGEYNGTIHIQPSDAPAMELPIHVRVWPFELNDYPNDDERVFIYNLKKIYERYGNQWLSRDQIWDRVDGDLKLMKEYDIAPTAMFDWNTSMEDLRRFMALYLKYGFRGHPFFGGDEMTRMIDKHAKNPDKVKLDFQPYIKKMREVIAEQKKNNWPKFAFYCSAEIHLGMPGFQAAKAGLDEMKKAVPEAVLVALTNEPAELQVLANSGADILGPNAISMTQDGIELVRESGKKLWFYAWGRNRFRCGLIDWRVGSRGGLHEWYSVTLMAPFNPFDSTQYDSTNDAPPFIGPKGPIPTLGMEQTTAGRLDFLYLATLDRSIEAARKAKNPKAAGALKRAEALIESVKQRVKPDYYYYYKRQKQIGGTTNTLDVPLDKIFGWEPADYDQLRHQIAECISELQKTTGMGGGGSADTGGPTMGSAR
jgi:hypothetical protein